MTGIPGGRPAPGSKLLELARRLFSEQLMAAVIEPTIADLQREAATADCGAVGRLRVLWRGYRAFWTVMLFAPLSSLSTADAGAVGVQHVVAAAVVVTLLAIVGPALGPWVAMALAIGSLVAFAIHAWYDRHPLNVPIPSEPARRVPQINFSSMDVAGNVGGLIFVVGSVFIVVVGVPSVIWFLFAATVAGGLIAWALVAWHTSHPHRGLPENRIVLR